MTTINVIMLILFAPVRLVIGVLVILWACGYAGLGMHSDMKDNWFTEVVKDVFRFVVKGELP